MTDFRSKIQEATQLLEINQELKGQSIPIFQPLFVVTENRTGDFLESVPVKYTGSNRYEVLASSKLSPPPLRSNPSIFPTSLPAHKDPTKEVKWEVVPENILKQLSRLTADGTASKKFIVHGIDNLGSFVTHKTPILVNGFTQQSAGQEELQISTTVGQLVDEHLTDTGYEFVYLASTTQQRKVRLAGRTRNASGQIDLQLVSGATANIDLQFISNDFGGDMPQLPADGGKSKITFRLFMTDRYGNPVILSEPYNNPVSASAQITFTLKTDENQVQFYFPIFEELTNPIINLGTIQNFVDFQNGSYTAEYMTGSKMGQLELRIKNGNATTQKTLSILLGEKAELELINIDRYRINYELEQDKLFLKGHTPIADGDIIHLWFVVKDTDGNSVSGLTLTVNVDKGQTDAIVQEEEIGASNIIDSKNDEWKYPSTKSLYRVDYNPPKQAGHVNISVIAEDPKSMITPPFQINKTFKLPVTPNRPSSAQSTIKIGDDQRVRRPPADGHEAIIATVTIRDKNQNLIPGQKLKLVVADQPETAIPTIIPLPKNSQNYIPSTNEDGQVSFELKLKHPDATTSDSVLKVRVELIDIDSAFQPLTALVPFSSPKIAEVEFTQLPVELRGNGNSEGQVLLRAKNEVGELITNADMWVTPSEGEIVNEKIVPFGNGVYRGIYRSASRMSTITLDAEAKSDIHKSDLQPELVNNEFSLLAGDVSPTKSTVEVSEEIILANAKAKTTVEITLVDGAEESNPIQGQSVSLSIPDYSNKVIIEQPLPTNSKGKTKGYIRSSTVHQLGDAPIQVEVKVIVQPATDQDQTIVLSGKANRPLTFYLVPPSPDHINFASIKYQDGSKADWLNAKGLDDENKSEAILAIQVLDKAGDPVAPREPTMYLTASAGQISKQADHLGGGLYQAIFTAPSYPDNSLEIKAKIADLDNEDKAWLEHTKIITIRKTDIIPPSIEKAETVNSKEVLLRFDEPVFDLMIENWSVDENRVDQIIPQFQSGLSRGHQEFRLILVTPISPWAEPLVAYQTLTLPVITESNADENDLEMPLVVQDLIGAVQDLSGNFLPTVSIKAEDKITPEFQAQITGANRVLLTFTEPVIGFQPNVYSPAPDNDDHIGWKIQSGEFKKEMANFVTNFEPLDSTESQGYRLWQIDFRPEYDSTIPWFLPIRTGQISNQIRFEYKQDPTSDQFQPQTDLSGNPISSKPVIAIFKELPVIVVLDSKGNQLEETLSVSEGQTIKLDIVITNERLLIDEISSESPNGLFTVTMPTDNKITIESEAAIYTSLSDYKNSLSEKGKLDWVERFTNVLGSSGKNFLARSYNVTFGHNIATASIPKEVYPFVVSVEDKSFPNQPVQKKIQFEVNNRSLAARVEIASVREQLVADGMDKTPIMITITDSAGEPVEDEQVILVTNDGREFKTYFPSPYVKGNYQGVYTTNNDQIGDVIISAKTSLDSVSAQITIDHLPEQPDTVHLTIVDPELPADGNSITRLIVTLRDRKSRPIDAQFAYLNSKKNPQSPTFEVQKVEVRFDPPPKYGRIWGQNTNSTNSALEATDVDELKIANRGFAIGGLTGKHLAFYQVPTEFLPKRETVKIVAKVTVYDPKKGGSITLSGVAPLVLYRPNQLPTMTIKGPLSEISGNTLPTPLYENDELKLELVVEDPDQDHVNFYAENLPSGATLNLPTKSGQSANFVWRPNSQLVKAEEKEKTFTVTFHATDGRGGSVSRDLKIVAKHLSSAKQISLFATPNRLVVGQSAELSSANIRAIVSDGDGIRQPYEAVKMMAKFIPNLPVTEIIAETKTSSSVDTKNRVLATNLAVIEEEAGVYRAVFVAGTKSGRVSITAQIEGTNIKSKPVALEVLPGSISALMVTGPVVKKPNPIQLKAGESEFFTVWGQDEYYNRSPIPQDDSSVFQWTVQGNIGQIIPEKESNSDHSHRRFQFKAQSVGQGDITWSALIAGKKIEQKTDKIKVSPGPLDKILVDITEPKKLPKSVPIGEELTLEVTGMDAFGNSLSLTKDKVVWTVINDIGEMNTDSLPTSQPIAVFSPRQIGNGRISASVGNLKGQSTSISVVSGPLQRIEIKPIKTEYRTQDPIELSAGVQIEFSVHGFDQIGNQIAVPNALSNWQILSPTDDTEAPVGIGTYEVIKNQVREKIEPSGIYTFRATTIGLGRIDLTFKPSTGNIIKARSTNIKVSAGFVHALKIEPQNPTVVAGETVKFRITPRDNYDNLVLLDDEGISKTNIDESQDQEKLKQKIEIRLQLVKPTNNLQFQPIGEIIKGHQLEAKKTGVGQVKATLIRSEVESLPLHKRPPPIEVYAPVTVVAGPVTAVEIHPKEAFSVEVGKTVVFQAIGFDALGNAIPLKTGLKWTLEKLEGNLGKIDQEGKVEITSIGKANTIVTFTFPKTGEEPSKVLTGVSSEFSSGIPIPLQFTKTQRPKTIVGAGIDQQLVLPISAQNVPLPFQLLKGSMLLAYPSDLIQFEKMKTIGGFTVKNNLIQPGKLSLTWNLKLSPATRQEGAPVHFTDLTFTVLPTAKIGAISSIESISLQLEGSKGLIPSNRPQVEFHLLPNMLVDLVQVKPVKTVPLIQPKLGDPTPTENTPAVNDKNMEGSASENYIATVNPDEVVTFDLRVSRPHPSPIKLATGQINIKSVAAIASFELKGSLLNNIVTDQLAEDVQISEPKSMIRIKPISKGQALVIEDWDTVFGDSTHQATVGQLTLTISSNAPAKPFPLPITSTFESGEGDIFGLTRSKPQLLVLDNRPPTGTIIINEGRTHTNKLTVELNFAVTDSDGKVAQMRIANIELATVSNSNQPDKGNEERLPPLDWELFAKTKDWKLTEGEGEKLVYGQFKDQLGNLTTPALVGTIIYDITPPIASIRISDPDLKNPSTTIDMQPQDNLSNMLILGQVRLSNVFFDGKKDKDSQDEPLKWLPVRKEMKWNFSEGSGTKTVYVQFRDPAGNLSKVVSAEAEVDVTPPVIVKFSPTDQKTFVPINAPITITFSEAIDGQGLTNSSLEVTSLLTAGETQTVYDYDGILETAGSIIRFRAQNVFGNLTQISVRFDATVIDQYQNPIVQQKTWTFSTGLGIWPGDTNNDGSVDMLDVIPIGRYWQKQTIARQSESLMWLAQPAQPSISVEELTDGKIAATFADADGNGLVSANDIVPIAQNWFKTHQVPTEMSNAMAPTANVPQKQQHLSEQLDIYQQLFNRLERLPNSEGTKQLQQFLQEQILWIQKQLMPRQTQLLANYPNPFNPETWIPYQLANDGTVLLTIYNALGQVVRRLDLGLQTTGYYIDKLQAIHWDGRNQAGEIVTSGIYFYQLQVHSAKDYYAQTQKLILVK